MLAEREASRNPQKVNWTGFCDRVEMGGGEDTTVAGACGSADVDVGVIYVEREGKVNPSESQEGRGSRTKRQGSLR